MHTALFDPARHEALGDASWSDEGARESIRRIAADALAAFDPVTLWPTHAQDDPQPGEGARCSLYFGAGGVIWALRHLAAEGAIDGALPFDDVLPTLAERQAAGLSPAERGSFLMGDAGLLLLQWQAAPDEGLADRLFEVVQANLQHPSLEALWGHPGSALAAVHMLEATGQARWRAHLQAAARRLLDTMQPDPETGTPIWEQDLYGRRTRYLGAGHGLAGNVYLALRSAAWLDAGVAGPLVEGALATLQATALRDGNGWNWHPMIDARRVAGRLPPVQDCHGSPGLLNRLAGAPRSPGWDELLLAAGALTWAAGPLAKGPGLCHGTAGNALALLKLFQRTGDPLWRDRARALAAHAALQVERARGVHAHGRHSLWTGDEGVACVLWECLGAGARLPLMDVS